MAGKPMTLPPKMAAEYAQKALKGEGKYIGANCYDFIVGNTRVSLVSLDPPLGHVVKLSAAEAEKERSKQ